MARSAFDRSSTSGAKSSSAEEGASVPSFESLCEYSCVVLRAPSSVPASRAPGFTSVERAFRALFLRPSAPREILVAVRKPWKGMRSGFRQYEATPLMQESWIYP